MKYVQKYNIITPNLGVLQHPQAPTCLRPCIRSIQRRWDMVDCMLQSYSLSFEDQ